MEQATFQPTDGPASASTAAGAGTPLPVSDFASFHRQLSTLCPPLLLFSTHYAHCLPGF